MSERATLIWSISIKTNIYDSNVYAATISVRMNKSTLAMCFCACTVITMVKYSQPHHAVCVCCRCVFSNHFSLCLSINDIFVVFFFFFVWNSLLVFNMSFLSLFNEHRRYMCGPFSHLFFAYSMEPSGTIICIIIATAIAAYVCLSITLYS